MRIRTHYLIAMTLVATTLCVDQAVDAQGRCDAEPTRGLVDRLSDAIRRTVATRPMVRQRCPYATVTVVTPPSAPVRTTAVAAVPVCPACLPLPPPAI
jgi:hypothetical protein